jgi:putative MATE family efflux protein
MQIFTNDIELITRGTKYLGIVGVSYLLNGYKQTCLCIMRNSGKTTKSAVIGSSAMVFNLVFNAVFIYGLFGMPAMGIRGAAFATVLATAIESVWIIIESNRRDSVKLRMAYLVRIDSRLQSDFFKYTMPIVGNYLFWGLGVTMYSVIMGRLGSDAVAAFSIANISRSIITAMIAGVAAGTGIIVGNELGKNNIKAAKLYAKRTTVFSVICGVFSAGLLLLLRPFILGIANLSPSATVYLSGMLLVTSYYILTGSVNRTVIGGIFVAGGKSKFGLICDAIVLWLIIIPIGFFAAFYLELPVLIVFILISMDECVKVPVVLCYFRKYTWARNITREAIGAV